MRRHDSITDCTIGTILNWTRDKWQLLILAKPTSQLPITLVQKGTKSIKKIGKCVWYR